MNFKEVTSWVEAHPTESIVIGAGGVLVVLWLLGAFSSTPAASDSGASNLASAYYAAEAQQAVVGGQIQMATIQSAAQTAQVNSQANAAVAINAAQTTAATTINGQNASTTSALGNDQLLAAQSSNATAAFITHSDNLQADWGDVFNTVIPSEIAATGGNVSTLTSFMQNLPGGFNTASGGVSPNALSALGWTQSQINQLMGDMYGTGGGTPGNAGSSSFYSTLAAPSSGAA